MKTKHNKPSVKAFSPRRVAAMRRALGHSKSSSVTRRYYRNVTTFAWAKAFLSLFPQAVLPKSVKPQLKKARIMKRQNKPSSSNRYKPNVRVPANLPDLAAVMKVITVAKATDPLIALGIGLSRFAGLAVKDLLALLWKQVDLRCQVISVLATKPGSPSRQVMMAPELIAFFQEYPVGQPDDLIFAMSPEQYRRRLAVVRELAGIPAWGKDGLRKAYLIHSVWAGLDPKTAASLFERSPRSVDLSKFYKFNGDQS